MFKFFNLITIVFLVVSINGCGQNHEAQSQTIHNQPRNVGYLRIPLKTPVTTLDPGLAYDITHMGLDEDLFLGETDLNPFTYDEDLVNVELVEQLFLGLTDLDPQTYEVLPELATKWQVSEDGTVYTFHLRQDVTWTNGEPVTAHDVVWAIKRNLMSCSSYTSYTLYILKNATAIHRSQSLESLSDSHDTAESVKNKIMSQASLPLGVKAIDDYTVEFTLEYPAGYFPFLVSLWTYRPLPRKVIEEYGNKWTEPEHIQTNGSYQLIEWKKDSRLILKKNPDYYEADKVTIPEVHYYIIPDRSLGLAMYEDNELDILGGQIYLQLPWEEMPRITANPILRKEKYTSPHFCTEWYGFNTQKPPMDNPLVRKAIAAAIDKQTLSDFIMKGGHTPATTFIRPPIFGAVDPQENVGILFNPKKAKTWLAEAGYPDGNGFPPVTLMRLANQRHRNIDNANERMIEHYLNIDIEVRGLEVEPYLNNLKLPNTPHIFHISWCADYPDPNNWLYEVFHPIEGLNLIGWNNEEFKKIVDRARITAVPQERKQLYRRAEEILTQEEVAIVPLFFFNTHFLVKPWVKNWYNMSFGGQHIRSWRLDN
jgi:oligopeptide transport system substrate-binding protein